MSDPSQEPWSNNPYAPKISYQLSVAEKTNFAGFITGAIFYGIVIVLFFQCMTALLNPVNQTRGGVKWALVVHTGAMFSFVTIYTAINLAVQSISYIDNRDFTGAPQSPPGPFGYQFYISPEAISIIPSVVFVMNNWLADGLLLYRCYITYATNYWIIALPCFMYLATFGVGILFIYELSQPVTSSSVPIQTFGMPFYSISPSLNVILTLTIVTRLALHSRNVRNAMGAMTGTSSLYKAIITMLVESCALYAATYLLFIVPWAASSSVANAFAPIVAETLVIAPFLIILRVANQRALTSDNIVTGNITPIHFENQEKTTVDADAPPHDKV